MINLFVNTWGNEAIYTEFSKRLRNYEEISENEENESFDDEEWDDNENETTEEEEWENDGIETSEEE
ncbi:hypothetical protein H5410_015089 [Solanum commersonii]|uniref:Uncharacterized protein n=1 Tax=Solanum commersonii TaxID=4109 RepID=A0A9J5ZST3_SOLCO|nr:hypothetical protein H5410_015089 [Solanum commersonii]